MAVPESCRALLLSTDLSEIWYSAGVIKTWSNHGNMSPGTDLEKSVVNQIPKCELCMWQVHASLHPHCNGRSWHMMIIYYICLNVFFMCLWKSLLTLCVSLSYLHFTQKQLVLCFYLNTVKMGWGLFPILGYSQQWKCESVRLVFSKKLDHISNFIYK